MLGRRSRLVLLGLAVATWSSLQVHAQRRGAAPERGPDAKLDRVQIPGGPVETPAGKFFLIGDLYMKHPKETPLLVLFHSSRGSRGEFRKTGLRLSEMGYNGLAVDLRVGARSEYIRNLTVPQIAQHGVRSQLLDVTKDIETTLRYAREHFAEGPLICVGSASSATLVMEVVSGHPELADGLVLFSPPIGYFEQFGKPDDWALQLAKETRCPTFLTGLRSSRESLLAVFEALDTKDKVFFEPEGAGIHGAQALLPSSEQCTEYWEAFGDFLKKYYPLNDTLPAEETGER